MIRLFLLPFLFFAFSTSCGILDIGEDPLPGKFVISSQNESGEYSLSVLSFGKATLSGKIREYHQRILFTGQDAIGEPSWSPDGEKILFRTAYPNRYYSDFIHSIDQQGSNFEPITFRSGNPLKGSNAVWSPDGGKIAYQKCLFCELGSKNTDIYIYNFESDEESQVTNHEAADEFPTWNYESNALIFSSSRDYYLEEEQRWRKDLYKIELETENVERLTTTGNTGKSYWISNSNIVAYQWNIREQSSFYYDLYTENINNISEDLTISGLSGISRGGNLLMIWGYGKSNKIEFHLYEVNNSLLTLVFTYKSNKKISVMRSIRWYYDE